MIGLRHSVYFTGRRRDYHRLRQLRPNISAVAGGLLRREVGRTGVFVPHGRLRDGEVTYRSVSLSPTTGGHPLIRLYADENRRVYI